MKRLANELMFVIFLLGATLFTYLSISPEAGFILFGMGIIYLVAISSKFVKEVEILRSDKYSKNIPRILMFIGGLTIAWIIINSVVYSLGTGQSVQFFSTEAITQIRANTNIPILSQEPIMILFVWGFLFPAMESLFFLSVVLLFFHAIVWKTLNGKYKKLESINFKKDIWKIMFVAILVGATASLFHLQVRQATEWAMFGDFIFFSISATVVYKTRQIIEAMGFHAVINTLVLAVGGI